MNKGLLESMILLAEDIVKNHKCECHIPEVKKVGSCVYCNSKKFLKKHKGKK